MGDASLIEWTQATWNPVTGCDRVSAGCDNCYIERTPPFRMAGRRFDERGRMGVQLHPDRLDQPLHWRKPRRVFVNSLSDLFHKDVPDEFIAEVFAVMALAPQHTFQVLTKRPQRMARLLADGDWCYRVDEGMLQFDAAEVPEHWSHPLPNIWLGVSVENQRYADLRIPHLLRTPAAVRFLSCEPLLGPVALVPEHVGGYPESDQWTRDRCAGSVPLVDWVIVGGESGPGARPMHPEWARSLRDQCTAAGVPFFFKQWGEWAPAEGDGWADHPKSWCFVERDGTVRPGPAFGSKSQGMCRVGKKAAGRLLDGRTWDEMPEFRP